MKKAVKTFLAVLLLLVALNVNAADGLDLRINDKQNLIVELQQIEKGSVLSLKDMDGEVIFKDRFFEESEYSKTLDFNELPDGEYTLSFDKQYSIASYVISKRNEDLIIEDNGYSFVFKPSFITKENKVRVHLANPTQQTISLEIFDKEGIIVGSATSRDMVLKKTLDFSKTPKGEYTVKIKLGKESFTKTFTIG